MRKYHIQLTPEEEALVSAIDLRIDLPLGADRGAIYRKNYAPIVDLVKSLSARDGIPKRRLALWTDPELNPGGRGKSRRDVFAGNGSSGDEAYTHPNFLTILRFCLYGTDLPDAVAVEFEDAVGNPQWFSGSDIIALGKKVREMVRRFGLQGGSYPDAFMMLAIDCGLNSSHAVSVRNAAVDAGRR